MEQPGTDLIDTPQVFSEDRDEYNDFIWIGLKKDEKEEWHWVDGTKLDFTKWSIGEANNVGNAEGCGQVHAFIISELRKSLGDILCSLWSYEQLQREHDISPSDSPDLSPSEFSFVIRSEGRSEGEDCDLHSTVAMDRRNHHAASMKGEELV